MFLWSDPHLSPPQVWWRWFLGLCPDFWMCLAAGCLNMVQVKSITSARFLFSMTVFTDICISPDTWPCMILTSSFCPSQSTGSTFYMKCLFDKSTFSSAKWCLLSKNIPYWVVTAHRQYDIRSYYWKGKFIHIRLLRHKAIQLVLINCLYTAYAFKRTAFKTLPIHICNHSITSWSELLPLLEKKSGPKQCFMFENNVFPNTVTDTRPSFLPSNWQKVPGVDILTHLYHEPVSNDYSDFKTIVNPRAVFTLTVHGLLEPGTSEACSWVDRNIARMYHTR